MARIDLGKVVGDSATISVGNVTTLEAGENATVVNTGTELNGVFDFGIPKGPKGDKGDTGSQGPVGPQGVQGKAFTIDKTYSSVLDMQADFNNMEVGSYVMIASNVESEDNARLYYRDTNEWKFISDFSGATGIQGEQGPQGAAGYTPVKGVDYFTSADIAEIEDDIKEITGELADLDTTDKSNLVSAINEVASSSGGDAITFVDTNTFYLSGKKKGIYYLTAQSTSVYYDDTYSSAHSISPFDGFLYLLKDVDSTIQDGELFGLYMMYSSNWLEVHLLNRDTSDSFSNIGFRQNSTRFGVQLVTANTIQTITGKKTFNTLPETSIAPTTNDQLTNKKYVDDAVASAGGGDDSNLSPIYDFYSSITYLPASIYLPADDLTKLTTIINDAYSKGKNSFGIVFSYNKNNGEVISFMNVPSDMLLQAKPTECDLYSIITRNIDNTAIVPIISYMLRLSITWNNDEATITSARLFKSTANFLSTTNTSSYTPIGDYNPATKKYVDDSIAAAITTTLGGSY